MAERVCIPNADQAHPTFHRIGEVTFAEHDWQVGLGVRWHPAPRAAWHTGCNAALVDPTYGIKSIRRDRAELFARPCRRCFGEDASRG